MSVREAPLRAAPTTPRTPTKQRMTPLLFVGLMLGLLLAELDQTMFSTALPTIVGELGGVDRMLWVTTAYVLAGTVVMPVYGKLGDVLGRKPLFIAALSVFVAGSVLGGLAPDMTWLIVARAVQGLGGGGLLILIQGIIADVVPARERAASMSVVGAVFALSAMLGPVLGGWLTDGLGWRWAFWINLPLGAAAIASGAAFLPSAPGRGRPVRIDVAGIVAMTVAVTAIVLVASWGGVAFRWGSPVIVSISAIAVLASAAFIAAERQAADPIIPLALFRNRTFTAATIAGLVMAVAMFGAIGYLPTYLQMVSGLGASGAGLVMLTLVAGLAVTSVGSAQIVRRTGQLRVASGRRLCPRRGCFGAALDSHRRDGAAGDRQLPLPARCGHRVRPGDLGPGCAKCLPGVPGGYGDGGLQLLPRDRGRAWLGRGRDDLHESPAHLAG